MKKILMIVLALVLCLAMAACGKTASEPAEDTSAVESVDTTEADTPENTDSTGAATENLSKDTTAGESAAPQDKVPANVLKATYRNENSDEVVLYQNDDESYGMVIAIDGLVELEGSATVDGDGFRLNGKVGDAPVTLHFYPETDSYTLEVVESAWESLAVGQAFHGFTPVVKG